MKLIKLSIKHFRNSIPKTISLSQDTNLLYSSNNSTGKTTLMRSILYALGFQIPSTKKVNFSNYEFTLTLNNKNKEYILFRKDQYFRVNNYEFTLPTEQDSAQVMIFGTTNPEILHNVLGTIYFDQEKGWTLLNRGTSIGINKFSVEAFFRGLKDDESTDSYSLVEKLNKVDKKISQYKLMSDIAKHQNCVAFSSNATQEYRTREETIFSRISELRIKLDDIENELKRVKDSISSNNNFSDYITSKRIYIKNPSNSDEPILITKNNLLDYTEIEQLNIARKSFLLQNKAAIKKELANLLAETNEQIQLTSFDSLDQELSLKFSNIEEINARDVEIVLNRLYTEKKSLDATLKERTRNRNPWIEEAYETIMAYASELDFSFSGHTDIFTHNLRSISGSVLHKMVFAYKLAYIKLLSKKLEYPLPIFCDSPSGREVEPETIKKMLTILKRDFSKHQLIIASIYDYKHILGSTNIIPLNRTLFNYSSDLEQYSLFDDN